jgi:hypothetical protein
MKYVLLAGIAALFLTTGTAHAINWTAYKCSRDVYVTIENQKQPERNGLVLEGVIVDGLRDASQLRRVRITRNGVYFNRRLCKTCPPGYGGKSCDEEKCEEVCK